MNNKIMNENMNNLCAIFDKWRLFHNISLNEEPIYTFQFTYQII
jgi:hypothetical protein